MFSKPAKEVKAVLFLISKYPPTEVKADSPKEVKARLSEISKYPPTEVKADSPDKEVKAVLF
jgi:hypothetical protein